MGEPPVPVPVPVPVPGLYRSGFHEETLDDAIAQLRTVLPLLVGRLTSIRLAALGDDGEGHDGEGYDDGDGGGCGLDAWLNAALSTPATSAVQVQAQAQESGLESGSGGDDVDGRPSSSSSSGDHGLPSAPSSTVTITTAAEAASATGTRTTTTTITPDGAATRRKVVAETTRPPPTTTTSIALLPSVRCGIEMAVVHLVARAAGVSVGAAMSSASGLPCGGSIKINGLATRGERPSEAEQAVRCVFFFFSSEGENAYIGYHTDSFFFFYGG